MAEFETDTLDTCPFCGRERSEWTENEGQGVTATGVMYCSQDCLVRDEGRGYGDSRTLTG
jgi:hypothetical protein